MGAKDIVTSIRLLQRGCKDLDSESPTSQGNHIGSTNTKTRSTDNYLKDFYRHLPMETKAGAKEGSKREQTKKQTNGTHSFQDTTMVSKICQRTKG